MEIEIIICILLVIIQTVLEKSLLYNQFFREKSMYSSEEECDWQAKELCVRFQEKNYNQHIKGRFIQGSGTRLE